MKRFESQNNDIVNDSVDAIRNTIQKWYHILFDEQLVSTMQIHLNSRAKSPWISSDKRMWFADFNSLEQFYHGLLVQKQCIRLKVVLKSCMIV